MTIRQLDDAIRHWNGVKSRTTSRRAKRWIDLRIRSLKALRDLRFDLDNPGLYR